MHTQPYPHQNLPRIAHLIAFVIALSALNTPPALANAFGLVDGQAHVPGQFDYISIDLGGRVSEDTLGAGARLSVPAFNKHLVLFIDAQNTEGTLTGIALGNDVDVSGGVQGGGLYITDLPPWRNFTTTLRLSAQSQTLDVDSNIVVSGIQAQTRLKDRSASLALLLSPATALLSNGTNVYVALGASYQRQRRTVKLNGLSQTALYRYDQRYVPYLAAGIVYPYKRLSVYTSVEYEDEWGVGLGVRINLRKSTYAKQ